MPMTACSEIVMVRGKVKWFNVAKGFGFISVGTGEKDVLFHITELQRAGITGVNDGVVLEFETTQTNTGPEATNIKIANDHAQAPANIRSKGLVSLNPVLPKAPCRGPMAALKTLGRRLAR